VRPVPKKERDVRSEVIKNGKSSMKEMGLVQVTGEPRVNSGTKPRGKYGSCGAEYKTNTAMDHRLETPQYEEKREMSMAGDQKRKGSSVPPSFAFHWTKQKSHKRVT